MNLSSFKRVIYSLDVMLSSAGILWALALILLASVRDKPSYAEVGIILLLACIAYLLLLRGTGFPDTSEPTRTHPLYLLFNILFFAGFMFTMLSLHLRSDPYVRPLSYFVAIAIMAGILAAEIIFLPRSKPHSWLVLTQIMLIPLSLAWSQLLLFPTLIGDDPWWHQWFTQSILDSGFVSGSSSYARLPVTHLVSGTTMLVTGLDFKMAALLSISSMNIICLLLFTFLIGRLVFSDKTGLLAALILGISIDFVGMSFRIMPNTFAAFMMLPIIYTLFKLRTSQPLVAISLSLLLMLALILTHTIVSMCMAILLLALWVGFAVFNWMHNQRKTPVTLGIVILFVIMMFGWWTYSSRHLTILAHLLQWGFSIDYWLPSVPVQAEMAQYTHIVPVFESLFNSVGRYLLIGISLPGCFYVLSKKVSHPYAFAVAVGALAVAGMTLIASVAGWGIQTGRWHYFVQILVSVPLAVSLLLFAASIKNGVGKVLSVTILTTTLACLMILTPTANLDNPVFNHTVVQKAYEESELKAVETMQGLTDQNIAIDNDPVAHFVFLPRFASNRLTPLGVTLVRQAFTDLRGSVIMIRRAISQDTLGVGMDSYIRLNYDPTQVLADEGFSHVYECGTVSAFWWNSNQPLSQGEP